MIGFCVQQQTCSTSNLPFSDGSRNIAKVIPPLHLTGGGSRSGAMTNLARRFRLVPIQVILFLAALFCFVMWQRSKKVNLEAKWQEIRDEELKKYQGMREVSLDFIRHAGHVDYRIEDLGEDELNGMNETQLMVTVHSFLDNADAICKRRIRMGSLNVGGWEICDDDLVRPKQPPCLVYSFGAPERFAFEDDISRVYKCEVHAFKVDMEGGDYNRSDLIFVHPFGVGKYTEITPAGKELYTFGDIRTILNHKKRNIDVVKLDIEYAEWSALYNMLDEEELDNVRQVLVEYHLGALPSEDRLRRMLRILRGMSKAGFRKFYVHKSPKGSFHHPNFPVVRSKSYEIHYLNQNYLKKKDKKYDDEEDEEDEEEEEDEDEEK
ncbi:hypothetical protein RRG08_002465 [Elysia crispata]|uniref:Methyltransferase domain-containing protein n=1 Tax=Elysia crispata TaxID=231223 RepID=A0AAE1DV98_9GAST|nr:hypothetical protein RRG08_002465 [Elysia crispata]